MNGDREDLLGPLLPDDILVERGLDLGGLGQAADLPRLLLFPLLGDDVVAELDALVADVDGGTGDQLADVVLALAAERALQRAVALARPRHPSRDSLATSGPAPPTARPARSPPGSSAWRRSPRRRFYSPWPARRS